MTYQQVLDIIKAALTERPSGTKVQVENHESAEIAILDYIEMVKGLSAGSVVRESHSSVSAGALCNLTWDVPFTDTNYSYVVNGFDASGNPVEIQLVSKSSSKIVVKTLVNATLNAMAKIFGTDVQDTNIREAHANSSVQVNCDLVWNEPFANFNYGAIVNGFDNLGNPVEIQMVSKSTSKIVVKTLVNATITALARPYSGDPD